MKYLVLLAILAALLVGCGGTPAGRDVTIDARDESGQVIDPVNVWDNYQTRGAVVARVHHGDHVTLISRNGNGAEIVTSNGARGWLTYTFIRELK
jgi:PBP1b-binding outer membrane lipoprotein LpoB